MDSLKLPGTEVRRRHFRAELAAVGAGTNFSMPQLFDARNGLIQWFEVVYYLCWKTDMDIQYQLFIIYCPLTIMKHDSLSSTVMKQHSPSICSMNHYPSIMDAMDGLECFSTSNF